MRRVPEPELMLDPERARAYAHADFSAAHDRFVALLGARIGAAAIRGHLLDLGCGPADVTLRVARKFPGVRLDGVDGSEAMLTLGREATANAGLADRVTLFERTLPAERFPRAAYDGVISNSLLHHLGRPSVLWESIVHALRSGGWCFVMDLLRPPDVRAAELLVRRYASAEPEPLRQDFRASLLAAYRIEEVRRQLRSARLEQLRSEVVSDRHWIAWGRLRAAT